MHSIVLIAHQLLPAFPVTATIVSSVVEEKQLRTAIETVGAQHLSEFEVAIHTDRRFPHFHQNDSREFPQFRSSGTRKRRKSLNGIREKQSWLS
jgi:hypothetical protein